MTIAKGFIVVGAVVRRKSRSRSSHPSSQPITRSSFQEAHDVVQHAVEYLLVEVFDLVDEKINRVIDAKRVQVRSVAIAFLWLWLLLWVF